jgi:hypothetical protein
MALVWEAPRREVERAPHFDVRQSPSRYSIFDPSVRPRSRTRNSEITARWHPTGEVSPEDA